MSDAENRPSDDLGTLAKRGGLATVVATVVNAAIVLAVPPAIDHPPYAPLSLGSVALFTVLGVVAATAVYAVILRLSARPERTFLAIAAVVLLLSFVPDLTFAGELPGATSAGVALLMVMHVVAAVVAVTVLVRGVAWIT